MCEGPGRGLSRQAQGLLAQQGPARCSQLAGRTVQAFVSLTTVSEKRDEKSELKETRSTSLFGPVLVICAGQGGVHWLAAAPAGARVARPPPRFSGQ